MLTDQFTWHDGNQASMIRRYVFGFEKSSLRSVKANLAFQQSAKPPSMLE